MSDTVIGQTLTCPISASSAQVESLRGMLWEIIKDRAEDEGLTLSSDITHTTAFARYDMIDDGWVLCLCTQGDADILILGVEVRVSRNV